jgi:hypothetical protein
MKLLVVQLHQHLLILVQYGVQLYNIRYIYIQYKTILSNKILRRTDTSHAVAITPVLHSYLPLSLIGCNFLTINLRIFPYEITSYFSGFNSGRIFY